MAVVFTDSAGKHGFTEDDVIHAMTLQASCENAIWPLARLAEGGSYVMDRSRVQRSADRGHDVYRSTA